jgi:ferredoxin
MHNSPGKVMKRAYQERRTLRLGEGLWARGEALLNHLTTPAFNPFYHLGTISIFLLLILTITGVYLTIFYRPGADQAYQSVAWISASWLGSLMRSVHRYAADGLIVMVLLHALKMLLGDRFWGSRWLAWITGWVLLALLWFIGAMGYWLVWDQRAQWLTEYGTGLLQGQIALTFLSAEGISRTFTFFVIVLFLHVFLSVIIALGLLLHLMRLARPRLWLPRWLMIEAVIALAIFAIWRPATSAPPADPSRLVGAVALDGWYLGFLPLAGRWGSGLVWGASVLLFVALLALPWLARGRSQGPAVVIEDSCTGCTVCVQECPYGAIEMRPLPEGSRYPALAMVNPALCTGCGLCVGACATDGIDLPRVPAAIVREHLKRALADARAANQTPVVVFACQGHVAMGTLPVRPATEATERNSPAPIERPGQSAGMGAGGDSTYTVIIPLIGSAPQRSQVTPGFWSGGNGQPALPVLTCALPCIGMVQPEMIRDSLSGGARAAVVLTGPDHDCGFREGPHWLVERLDRRKSLMRQGVYVLEAATGDQAPLNALLGIFARDQAPPEEAAAGRRQGISLAGALVVLLLAFGLALAVEWPATATSTTQGMMRVMLTHTAKLKGAASLSPEMQAKLPPGVTADQLLGGERHPVRVRMEVDEMPAVEREYLPSGLRHEGTAYGLESWALPPGRHQVRLWMMDDGATWRPVFDGLVEVEAGHVRALIYDAGQAAFVLQ